MCRQDLLSWFHLYDGGTGPSHISPQNGQDVRRLYAAIDPGETVSSPDLPVLYRKFGANASA